MIKPNHIVNKESDNHNNHIVHNSSSSCLHLPDKVDQETLGIFTNCAAAVVTAKHFHPTWQIDGCKHCCPDCHEST